MKTKSILTICFCLLPSAFCLSASAQGTAFTYQGVLFEQGAPANSTNDLAFALFNTASGGLPLTATNFVNDLAVTNGQFSITLDFGAGFFTGADRWLNIAVRPGDSTGAYTNLSPRQKITPTPYAIFAGSSSNLSGPLAANGLSGAYTNALKLTNGANVFKGTFTGNGANLTNVDAATLGGLFAAEFWQLQGNNVTPGDVLGSTNNQPLQFVVNYNNALRLEPNFMSLPNLVGGSGNSIAVSNYASVIGGGFANNIQTNAVESIIAGGSFNNIGPGSYSATIAGGANNKILSNSQNATLVAGESNTIDTNCAYAVVGGGGQNNIFGNNAYSFIGGGNANLILIGANYGFIGGGRNNTNSATTSVIAGGEGNSIQSLADRSFIGGGLRNVTTGALGMVPGGFANSAAGQAFAAGRRAKANDTGSFVWADSTDADFASSAQNQFNVRASGGYRIYSSSGLSSGVTMAAGGNAWSGVSDRNVKENFQQVDCRALLEKVVALPVTTWNLKTQPPEIRHIGAMAQDFMASFAVGEDDKHISTSDADGVTLAAIQGLNQKLEDRAKTLESELKQKETEITKLQQRLDALEKLILNQNSN
jgi:hypothetical protein